MCQSLLVLGNVGECGLFDSEVYSVCFHCWNQHHSKLGGLHKTEIQRGKSDWKRCRKHLLNPKIVPGSES